MSGNLHNPALKQKCEIACITKTDYIDVIFLFYVIWSRRFMSYFVLPSERDAFCN